VSIEEESVVKRLRVKREPMDDSVAEAKEELVVVKKEHGSSSRLRGRASRVEWTDEDDVPLVMPVAVKKEKAEVKVKVKKEKANKEKVKVKQEPVSLRDAAFDAIPAPADRPSSSASSRSKVKVEKEKPKPKKAKTPGGSAVVAKVKAKKSRAGVVRKVTKEEALAQFKATLRAERGFQEPSSFPEVILKIVGTSFRHKAARKSFSRGGEVLAGNIMTTRQRVILEPEPTNAHDQNAIKVVISGVHVGYVPKWMTPQIDTQAAAMLVGWRVMDHGLAAGECTGKVLANL
jgi:hypothetical protein